MKKKICFLSVILFLFLDSNLYALTKDSILKITRIQKENLYCLYSANESMLASLDSSKNYVYLNIDNKIKEVKKTTNQFKKKYLKAKTKKLKNKYYKSFQKSQKNLKALQACKSYKPLEIACEIFEGNNLKSANPKVIKGVKCKNPEKGQVVKVVIDTGNTDGTYSLCTGTLISQNAILTAAHCIDSEIVKSIKVYFGKNSFDVSKWYINPEYIYDPFAGDEYGDIALLFTKKKINKKPFKLVSKNYVPKNGELVAMIGYGIMDYKYKALYSYKNGLYAGFTYLSEVTPVGIRARYDASKNLSNTCKGDSGGPLAIYADGEWKLLGVASWEDNQYCGFFQGYGNNWWSRINSKENIEFLEKYLPGIYN